MLDELGSKLGQVAELIGPSVVGVSLQRMARGSGIIVSDGKVLTNAHNLRGETAAVTFSSGERETGRVAGFDLDADLAILDVDTGDLQPLAWASNGHPALGSPVVALANPGGMGLRVTFGTVSGTERSFRTPRRRRVSNAVEHTAPLLPGSSGGPLVDLEGHLVGINTHRIGGGFYLAIPASADLRRHVDRLAAGEDAEPRRLGVGILGSSASRQMRAAVGLEARDGLLVRVVEEGGPADAAGVQQGDLLVSFDGRSLATADDLYESLAGAGEDVSLGVVRGTDELALEVSFGNGGAS